MLSQLQWTYSAHPDLQALLSRIDSSFGSGVVVLDSTPEWLTFRVSGQTDYGLIRELERMQHELFGSEMWRYQVLHSQGENGAGVSIRVLTTSDERTRISSGFWSY